MSFEKESEYSSFRKFRGDPDVGICVVFNLNSGAQLFPSGRLKDHVKVPVLELPERLSIIEKQGAEADVTRQVIRDFLALAEPPEVHSPNPKKIEEKTIYPEDLQRTQEALRQKLADQGLQELVT